MFDRIVCFYFLIFFLISHDEKFHTNNFITIQTWDFVNLCSEFDVGIVIFIIKFLIVFLKN